MKFSRLRKDKVMGSPAKKAFGFLTHVEELIQLFDKADKKELEAAFAEKDLIKISKALHISTPEFKAMLNSGKEGAEALIKKYPEIAEAK
jgi:hypothetical protein